MFAQLLRWLVFVFAWLDSTRVQMPAPQAFSNAELQPAPVGDFDLNDITLTKCEFRHKHYLVAQLQLPDASAQLYSQVVNNLKTGEGRRGNCVINSGVKGSAASPHGGAVYYNELTCANGNERKKANRDKLGMESLNLKEHQAAPHSAPAAQGVAAPPAPHAVQPASTSAMRTGAAPPPANAADLRASASADALTVTPAATKTAAHAPSHAGAAAPASEPAQPAQGQCVQSSDASTAEQRGSTNKADAAKQRRSKIARGFTAKQGCMYCVLVKVYKEQPDILWLQVQHKEHVTAGGTQAHTSVSAHVSEDCRTAVYEHITQGWTTDDILAGVAGCLALICLTGNHACTMYQEPCCFYLLL